MKGHHVWRLWLAGPVAGWLTAGCFLVIGEIPDGSGGGGADAAASGGSSGSASGGAAGASGAGGAAGACLAPPCDCDDDGFGKLGCATGSNDDCDDSDPDAHPGQIQFFDHPRNGGGYDYDCDTNITPETTSSVSCKVAVLDCPEGVQGYTDLIPQCGEAADFGYCNPVNLECVKVVVEQRVQRCR